MGITRRHALLGGLIVVLALLAQGASPALAVSVQPGWPQTTGDWVESSPALGDLDEDGHLEVIVGSNDMKVYAWHGNGTPVAGWPQTTGDIVRSSPALGDLDGDGDPEVVVGGCSGDRPGVPFSCRAGRNAAPFRAGAGRLDGQSG